MDSSSSSSNSFFSKFEAEFGQQITTHLSPADCTALEAHMDLELKLEQLRRELLSKFRKARERMEQYWGQIDDNGKSQILCEMGEYLYELQLIENASKEPLLKAAKLLFSLDPRRCMRRETSPAKIKSPKRRRNELSGLISSTQSEDNLRQSAREAKLFAAAANHIQQQYLVYLDDLVSSNDNDCGNGRKAPAGRVKRRSKTVLKGVSPALSPSNEDNVVDNEDDLMEGEEEDGGSLNMVLKSPSPLAAEDWQSSAGVSGLESPQRVDSTNSQQNVALPSPPGRIKKKGNKEGIAQTQGEGGGRSPRKRAAERNNSGNCDPIESEQMEEDCHEEVQVPADEPTYCLCEQVSFGDMICCDYELCSVEWFHFSCVNIKSKPKGKKWFCPLCRLNDKPNLLKPELHQKFEQMKRTQGE